MIVSFIILKITLREFKIKQLVIKESRNNSFLKHLVVSLLKYENKALTELNP